VGNNNNKNIGKLVSPPKNVPKAAEHLESPIILASSFSGADFFGPRRLGPPADSADSHLDVVWQVATAESTTQRTWERWKGAKTGVPRKTGRCSALVRYGRYGRSTWGDRENHPRFY